jgi:hypothetical protein
VEKKVLPKNLEADVRSQDQMYSLKYHSGHTVQSVKRNFVFTSHPIAPISLFYSCFSRKRANDRSFLSIRGCGTSKELHEGALRPG